MSTFAEQEYYVVLILLLVSKRGESFRRLVT